MVINKLIDEILKDFEMASYHDLYEKIYDEIKFLKNNRNKNIDCTNNLHDLLNTLNDMGNNGIIDNNGDLEKIKNKLENNVK